MFEGIIPKTVNEVSILQSTNYVSIIKYIKGTKMGLIDKIRPVYNITVIGFNQGCISRFSVRGYENYKKILSYCQEHTTEEHKDYRCVVDNYGNSFIYTKPIKTSTKYTKIINI